MDKPAATIFTNPKTGAQEVAAGELEYLKPDRKKPVAHIDVLRANIDVQIPIDAMDMNSIQSANAVLDEIKAVVTKHKASAVVLARLARVRGDVFP